MPVGFQGRHQLIRGDPRIGRELVVASGNVDRHIVKGQPLEVEGNANPKRGRGAEIVVELHARKDTAIGAQRAVFTHAPDV